MKKNLLFMMLYTFTTIDVTFAWSPISYLCSRNQPIYKPQPNTKKYQAYALGTAAVIGIYSLWKYNRYRYTESLYQNARILNNHFQTIFTQELFALENKSPLDKCIESKCQEYLMSLSTYLNTVDDAITITHQLHKKLYGNKQSIAHYHTDIQKILNMLATLHNKLYFIKKETFGMIGVKLYYILSNEYEDELKTIQQYSKNEIDIEQLRKSLSKIVLGKKNRPTNNYPYHTYFHSINPIIEQLDDALKDIDTNHIAHKNLSQLQIKLNSIIKILLTLPAYIDEKESQKNHLCCKKFEERIEKIEEQITKLTNL
jgi:hypothetical protein